MWILKYTKPIYEVKPALFDGQTATRRTGLCLKKERNLLKEEGVWKIGVKIVLCGDEMPRSGSEARSQAYTVKRIMSYDT